MLFFKPNINKMKSLNNLNGLVKALKNKDKDIRIKAKFAISDLITSQKDNSSIKILINTLGKNDVIINSSITDILLQKTELLLPYIDEIKKGDKELKWRCAELFGRTKNEKAVDYLRFCILEDSDGNVQETALWSLNQIGTTEAFKVIEEFRNNQSLKYEKSFKNSAVSNKASSYETSSNSNLLVTKLVSNNELEFLSGLNEAITFAYQGSSFGLDAIKEAIRIRSGHKKVRLYQPGISIRSGEYVTDAPLRLLELAKHQHLLKDPYETGNLIAATVSICNENDLKQLLQNIYDAGGTEQGYIFQLLYNYSKGYATLLKSAP